MQHTVGTSLPLVSLHPFIVFDSNISERVVSFQQQLRQCLFGSSASVLVVVVVVVVVIVVVVVVEKYCAQHFFTHPCMLLKVRLVGWNFLMC